MPDTQDYADGGAPSGEYTGQEVFHEITQWIVDNKESQRIVFVSHVGDIVNSTNYREQWEFARSAMDILHGVIPYGLAPGNHDMDRMTGEKILFEEFFEAERFSEFEWYSGTPDNNGNSYQLVSAERVNMVFCTWNVMHLMTFFPGRMGY